MLSVEEMKGQQAKFRDVAGLAANLLEICRGRSRILAGIAGIPGSGKSTLAESLCAECNRLEHPGFSVVVPQDGFHLSNSELEKLGLASRKGSPETFNSCALLEKLTGIRRGGSVVRVPVYSREIHEPVPDAVEIPAGVQLVLVEGNYLFCNEGNWRAISALIDIRIFVAIAKDTARSRVIARHVRGGLSPEAAVAKYERNDRPNSDLVSPTVRFADCVFDCGDTGRIGKNHITGFA